MPITGDWNLNEIDRTYHKYNARHPCLLRLNDSSFLVRFPGDWPPGVLTALEVQLYANHNMRLYDASLNVTHNPWGYRDFAMLMNRHDDSGFGWAFYSHLERRIKYPPAELEPATIHEFMVHDSDIESREFVARGNVQVPAEWYEETIKAAQRREVARARSIRESKRNRSNLAGLSNINSAENKAALAKKRALEEEEFQNDMREQAAQRKRTRNEVEEGEVSDATVTGSSGSGAKPNAPVVPTAGSGSSGQTSSKGAFRDKPSTPSSIASPAPTTVAGSLAGSPRAPASPSMSAIDAIIWNDKSSNPTPTVGDLELTDKDAVGEDEMDTGGS
ncbi:polyprotein [Mycena venus]|uniref:Polyprotein n=1 Tax=Mycena venus TaxID=2733690 RepID=A0A8H7CF33_9AGAR|nr:polyprotein [Mycena venus]